MSNEEGNKLIAEFMGYYFDIVPTRLTTETWIRTTEGVLTTIGALKYDSSWDWLMPVVEKISQMHKDGIIHRKDLDGKPADRVFCLPLMCEIQTAWKAVTQFIQWYNTNKPI